MPRRPRYWVPGGIYHITLRGNNRQRIFVDTADYRQYLLLLNRCRNNWPTSIVAFALMPNHVHLVIEATPNHSPSEALQWLSAMYTRYFNERHQCVGHLYQGRFYSNAVDRDSYLLEVTRYVHLNPFRAHLVQQPADYAWSSFRVYVGLEQDPWQLVNAERILSAFGNSPSEQAVRYRQFVEELADHEREAESWIRRLTQQKLIPPPRWLNPRSRKVSDTSTKVSDTLSSAWVKSV